MMARFSAMTNTSYCGTAAACSSVHLIPILDTAVILAVSISICLLPLRILGLCA